MTRLFRLFVVAAAFPALTGCVASMAVSALGMAAQSARGRPVSNEALQPKARQQCSDLAAHFGTVNIIDVEQHRIDQIIVWGRVDTGTGKASFQCDFGTKVTKITWRPITPQR